MSSRSMKSSKLSMQTQSYDDLASGDDCDFQLESEW